jgi:NAD+ diphosphatase
VIPPIEPATLGREVSMIEIKYCPSCKSELVYREIEGRQYKACADKSCGYVFYDNPLVVVAALVEHEGKLILARNRAWPEGWFYLVTGFLEKNERPEDAVVREVKEELGLNAKIANFIGIYPFFEMNQLILAYHLTASGDIRLGEELAEVKHVSPEDLQPWPLGTGHAVRDWLKTHKERHDAHNS